MGFPVPEIKHDRQWPGGSPLWLEQVLIKSPKNQILSKVASVPSHQISSNTTTLLSVSPLPSPPSHHTNWMLLQILATWYDSRKDNDAKCARTAKRKQMMKNSNKSQVKDRPPPAHLASTPHLPDPSSTASVQVSFGFPPVCFYDFCCSQKVETILTSFPPLPN